jgi:hypothetical protein
VTIPIRDGKLATGTWQGIWYLEFRASKHQRKVIATIQGERVFLLLEAGVGIGNSWI